MCGWCGDINVYTYWQLQFSNSSVAVKRVVIRTMVRYFRSYLIIVFCTYRDDWSDTLSCTRNRFGFWL
jgi:hypothetical protein